MYEDIMEAKIKKKMLDKTAFARILASRSITVAQVSNDLNIPAITLYQYSSKAMIPGLRNASRIAKYLSLPISEVFPEAMERIG